MNHTNQLLDELQHCKTELKQKNHWTKIQDLLAYLTDK